MTGPEPTTPSPDGRRPWPPPGPDTGWWRDDGGARPFTPSSTGDIPAPPATTPGDNAPNDVFEPPQTVPGPPGSGQSRSGAPSRRTASRNRATDLIDAESQITQTEKVGEDQPPMEATPVRRTSNVGPDGFPTRRMGDATRVGRLQTRADAAEGEPTGHNPILRGFPTEPERSRSAAGAGVRIGQRADTSVPTSTKRSPKDPRRPITGLLGLLIFAFLAAFLSWFAAGPLWLSLGHGSHGTATVVNCPVGGMSRRCADFVAADRSFAAYVALLGPSSMNADAGAKINAQMVNEDASTAYAGDAASLYLRWVPSVILVLLCGFGIAWASGAYRLPSGRARVATTVGSFLAPVLLLIGMLAFTY